MIHTCTCMPTPCCLANASFSLFRSKRTILAFRQRGLFGSGPNPGSTKKREALQLNSNTLIKSLFFLLNNLTAKGCDALILKLIRGNDDATLFYFTDGNQIKH